MKVYLVTYDHYVEEVFNTFDAAFNFVKGLSSEELHVKHLHNGVYETFKSDGNFFVAKGCLYVYIEVKDVKE